MATSLYAQTPSTLNVLAEESISVGFTHSCAVYDGAAWCWGDGRDGRLGSGNMMESPEPVKVVGLDNGVTAISVSKMHSCAIQNEAAKCWGNNRHDQIGDGTRTQRSEPEDVMLPNHGVTAISASLYAHTCAIQDGKAWCWGAGGGGRLGFGDESDTSIPRGVFGLGSSVTAISAGDRHGCAIHNGAAKCWGSNRYGEIGNSTQTQIPQLKPDPVNGLDGLDITAIAAGGHHSCAVAAAIARCWGQGSKGQLGDGTMVMRLKPVEVKGLNSGATAIAAGWSHTCAIVNAAAHCWGRGEEGQLGNASRVQSSVAVSVEGLDDGVTAIAAGGSFPDSANMQTFMATVVRFIMALSGAGERTAEGQLGRR